jgi:hypothetical protein
MDTIPSIVLNKIYWYLWHNKQQQLCNEYHQKILYFEYYDIGRVIFIQASKDLKLLQHIFNWRTTPKSKFYISNFDHLRIAPLPKNYFYIPLEPHKID